MDNKDIKQNMYDLLHIDPDKIFCDARFKDIAAHAKSLGPEVYRQLAIHFFDDLCNIADSKDYPSLRSVDS